MITSHEWDLWTVTAREVEQIQRTGKAISKLARGLCDRYVEPANNRGAPCLETDLYKIEQAAKHVLEYVEKLRRFVGVPEDSEWMREVENIERVVKERTGMASAAEVNAEPSARLG